MRITRFFSSGLKFLFTSLLLLALAAESGTARARPRAAFSPSGGMASTDTSNKVRACWQKAAAAMRVGNYAEAEAEYRRLIALDPSIPEAYVNLGLMLHLQKKQEEAIRTFQQAIKLEPALSNAYLFLGIDLFNLNRTSKALPILQKYTALVPSDPQGHYYLGLTFASRGDSEKATQSLETAARLAPKDVDVLYHLAQSYITQANQIVRRLTDFKPKSPLLKMWEKDQRIGIAELVRKSPTDPSGGQRLLSGEKEREAIAKLKPLLGRTPPNEQAEVLAAGAYVNLYVETTQKFYEIEPDSFRIHQLLAAYYESTSQTEKAIAELKQVLAINPNIRGAHFTLGSIYQGQGQPELALREFSEELKMASPYPETRLQLAQVYLTLREPDKALPLLLVIQKEDPEDAEVYRVLGKAYAARGDNEKAAVSFEQAIARGKTQHSIYYQLGLAYRKLGRSDLAAKAFDASQKASVAEGARDRQRQ